MKSLVKFILKQTPYRIVRRTSGNRFQAIEESLTSLRNRGYRPRRVIDCGANVGLFAKFALQLFPDAWVHAIEPQPGCQPDLAALAAKARPRLVTHAVALCEPERSGALLTMETDGLHRSTGAHVITGAAPSTGHCIDTPCSTLDQVLETDRRGDDRSLLKLDLQGYEMQALRGSIETLPTVEVILCEVSFYVQDFEPSIADLVGFLSGHGFCLYDIASIYARPRDDRPRQGDFIFLRQSSSLAADRSWA